jgi:hypothetical protein
MRVLGFRWIFAGSCFCPIGHGQFQNWYDKYRRRFLYERNIDREINQMNKKHPNRLYWNAFCLQS